MDPVTSALIAQLQQREARGLAKYGRTVSDAPLSVREWLTHLQEELLDGAVYIQRLLNDLPP